VKANVDLTQSRDFRDRAVKGIYSNTEGIVWGMVTSRLMSDIANKFFDGSARPFTTTMNYDDRKELVLTGDADDRNRKRHLRTYYSLNQNCRRCDRELGPYEHTESRHCSNCRMFERPDPWWLGI